MKKERNLQTFLIAGLMLVIIVMSIGFAAFSQNLQINGTATVKTASWDVRFDTATYQESAGSKAATSTNITDTSMTYAVTLPKPGDFYEFKIDAKNFGTIDAHLSSITMSALTPEQAKFLTYTLEYNGVTYSSNTTGLSIALNAGANQPVKVRVEYIYPSNDVELPGVDMDITLTATLGYQQTV